MLKFKNSEKISPLLALLVVLFTVSMLLSNIISNRQIAIGSFNTPGGVLIFPITYILSDIFSEVYGYKWSRRTAWIGFGMNLFMVVIFTTLNALPAPVWYQDTAAFQTVLGQTPRLLFAGLVAYMIGDFVNDRVFRKMRRNKDGHKGFGIRAIASSLCGEIVDSCIFMPLAFIGVLPLAALPQMIILQVLIKTSYEVIILPFTTILMKKISKFEQPYDYQLK